MSKRVKRPKPSKTSKPAKTPKKIQKRQTAAKPAKKVRYEVPEEQSKINQELNTMIKSLENSNCLLLEKLVKIEEMLDKSTVNTDQKVKKIKENWGVFQNEMEILQNNVILKSKEVFLESIKNEIKSKFDNLEGFVKECLEKKNSCRKRGRPRRRNFNLKNKMEIEKTNNFGNEKEKIIFGKDQKIENSGNKIASKNINEKLKNFQKIENKVHSLNEIKDLKIHQNNLITFGNIKKNTYNIGTEKNFENNKFLEDSITNQNQSIDRIDNIEGVMKLKPEKSIVLKQKNSALMLNNDSGDEKNDVIDPEAFSLSD